MCIGSDVREILVQVVSEDTERWSVRTWYLMSLLVVQHGVDEPRGQRRPRRSSPDDTGPVRWRPRGQVQVCRVLVGATSAVPDPVWTPHMSTVRRPTVCHVDCSQDGTLSRQRARLR